MSEQEVKADETSVSFVMPADLHRRLKIIAARENMTLKYILNGLVDSWVAKREKEEE